MEFLSGGALNRVPMLEGLSVDCRARLAEMLLPCVVLPHCNIFSALDIGLFACH